jgi:hypothetical protein
MPINPDVKHYEPGSEFCVIGLVNQQRTWKERKAEAIEHAKKLLRDTGGLDELLVVKVVARVRRAIPPIEVIHVK